MQDPFWMVRRFLEIRHPELLPEFMPLFELPRVETAKFLDKYFPLGKEIYWADTRLSETQDLLYSRYGKHDIPFCVDEGCDHHGTPHHCFHATIKMEEDNTPDANIQ